MVALGTAILWFGWLGYTGGATMGSGGQFVFAEANTIMAASVSMLCWMSLEWFNTGMPSMVGACMGVIAGLSAITAAAGFVLPWAAMLIGLLGSCACYFSVWLIKERLRWV
jgi:Amt family ammonium transporter